MVTIFTSTYSEKQQISTRTSTKKIEQKHKIGKTLSLVVYENFLFDCITLLN